MIKISPREIEVACHNGTDSCTISGLAGVMKEFVKLSKKSIFAKEVSCSNIVFHSRYIAKAGMFLFYSNYLIIIIIIWQDKLHELINNRNTHISTQVYFIIFPNYLLTKNHAFTCFIYVHHNNHRVATMVF